MSKGKIDLQLPTLGKMKVLILGDSNTGKTSFITKYLNPNSKNLLSKPTTGIDYYSQRLDVDGSPTYVHYWDLSGDDLYIEVRNEFYPESNGFLLFFDVTNRQSFEKLQSWFEEGTKYNADWSVCVIVANKCDEAPQVSKDEAESFAKKKNIKCFFSSAKNGTNVNEAIMALLLLIKKKQG